MNQQQQNHRLRTDSSLRRGVGLRCFLLVPILRPILSINQIFCYGALQSQSTIANSHKTLRYMYNTLQSISDTMTNSRSAPSAVYHRSCSDRDCGSLQYKTVLARRAIHSCCDILEKIAFNSQNCYSHSLGTYSQKDAKMRQMDTPELSLSAQKQNLCGYFHICFCRIDKINSPLRTCQARGSVCC